MFQDEDFHFPRFQELLGYECRLLGRGKKQVSKPVARTVVTELGPTVLGDRPGGCRGGVSAVDAEHFAQLPRARPSMARCLVKLAPRPASSPEVSFEEPQSPQRQRLRGSQKRCRPSWVGLLSAALGRLMGGPGHLSEAAWIVNESAWCFKAIKDRGQLHAWVQDR